MSTPDAEKTGGDHPVEVQEAIAVPKENIEAPEEPSDQPPLPDFNT
ncbi:MAG: hypothetical protein JWR11_725 [Mycobacterium sp.]|nr:hypothetical protein [Mycobacterium sp.]